VKTNVFCDVTPCVLVEVANISEMCRNCVTPLAFNYWQTDDICGNVINVPYNRHVCYSRIPSIRLVFIYTEFSLFG